MNRLTVTIATRPIIFLPDTILSLAFAAFRRRLPEILHTDTARRLRRTNCRKKWPPPVLHTAPQRM